MQTLSVKLSKSPATATALALLEALRQRLREPAFLVRHRRDEKAFTRRRVLTFTVVVLMILQQTVKSLQAHLHEFLGEWNQDDSSDYAGAGAFTRARAKLRHSAYQELNTQILLPIVYHADRDADLLDWRGHRMLGIDSSLIRLPMTEALGERFGLVECANQNGKSSVMYPEARISVLYDVRNHIGWDARLEPHTVAETEMARGHLLHVRPGDVLLCDRGYAGYFWFALMRAQGAEFVVRCSRGSFAAVQALFARDQGGVSQEITLAAPPELKRELREAGLPVQLRVRLVTVRLSTGELEVLATSLLDEKRYPTEEFVLVYHWRWGIETYYGRLKGRLELEHWSGKTEEAIRQDFHAAVFVSNLETVVCRSAEQAVEKKTAHRKYPAQLNRAVSLHTIKCQILALLASRQPAEKLLKKLQKQFMANPVTVRPDRITLRRKTPPGQAYQYQRNVRKVVF
jgi:hypothetical protein